MVKLKEKIESPPLQEHVLIRVRSEDGKTMMQHSRVLSESGVVMFGKMGSALGRDLIADLSAQIVAGVKTYVIFAVKKGWNGKYHFYKAELVSLSASISAEDLLLVPDYYRADSQKVSAWLKLRSLEGMTHAEATTVYVISSGREALSSLNSSASVFRVCISPHSAGSE